MQNATLASVAQRRYKITCTVAKLSQLAADNIEMQWSPENSILNTFGQLSVLVCPRDDVGR